MHAKLLFGALAVSVEVFSESAQVEEEDGQRYARDLRFGSDGY